MLFRAGGSSPEAAFGRRKAPPFLSDTARGEKSCGVGPLLREAQTESIAAGLACALLLIVWGGSGFPVPPHPWGDLVLGMSAVGFGCLMLVLMYRQKRNLAILRVTASKPGTFINSGTCSVS